MSEGPQQVSSQEARPADGGAGSQGPTALPPRSREPFLCRRARLELCGLILAAALVRFADIGGKSMWMDEAAGWLKNRVSLETITHVCMGSHTPPLREYLLHYLGSVPRPLVEAATRAPSAVASTLMVALVFFLGRQLFGKGAGLCAALFLVLHPWQVSHSQDARMHAVFLFFSALVFLQVCRLLYGKHRLLEWALLGATASLYAWFTYLSAMVFLAVASLIAVEWIGRAAQRERRAEALRMFGGIALAAGVFLLLYSPWLSVGTSVLQRYRTEDIPPAQQTPGDDAPEQAPSSPVVGTSATLPVAPSPGASAVPAGPVPVYTTRVDPAWIRHLLLRFGGNDPVAAAWAFVLFVAGIARVARRHRAKLWIVPCWFLAPIPFLIITSDTGFFPPRYMLCLLTVYALLVGLGAWALFEWFKGLLERGNGPRTAWAAALAALLALGPLVAFQSAGLARYYSSEKENWRDAVAFLEENAQDGDKILIGIRWARYGVEAYRTPEPGKRLRFVGPLSLDRFLVELQNDTNVWYIYWADLPPVVQAFVESRMEEAALFPGTTSNVRVLRKKTYIRL